MKQNVPEHLNILPFMKNGIGISARSVQVSTVLLWIFQFELQVNMFYLYMTSWNFT